MSRREIPGTARIRVDQKLIANMVTQGSRVIDVGCGDGVLLDLLVNELQVDGRGIELSQTGVNTCVSRGLAVVQGDAETDLNNYPDDAFDFALLSQTLPAIFDVKGVLHELLRIGRYAVVSFPNFGYWRVRTDLLFRGHSPISDNLPHAWYDSPNIRFFTLTDFVCLLDELNLSVQQIVTIDPNGKAHSRKKIGHWTNLLTEQAIFLIGRS
ncbi:MAG: methionine biosynthesis protein MetW [Alphaproteobacteria bacterium]|nr:methionine biosynthesis protein MetW [Alphaproteobacteria bacterium]|tara:strand:+ start:670 stop:1302 length:633 start_codon:yes stop_codon:yes gene_type:complete